MAKGAQAMIDMAVNILGPEAIHEDVCPPVDGIKNRIYSSSCPKAMIPSLYALVTGVLWSTDTVLACAEEEGLFSLEPSALPPGCPPLDPPPQELVVVLFECLMGSRRVRGLSPIVQLVQSRKASLQMCLAARRKRGATNKFVARVRLPRFLRINALKTTLAAAKAHLSSQGFNYVEPKCDASTDNTLSLQSQTYTQDSVLPGLLILPPGTSCWDDTEVERGALVLQDRSSCLSALALTPPAGAICIDTCASPGNKTLHMASLMGSGKITAFERDLARLATLQRRVHEQGADASTCTCTCTCTRTRTCAHAHTCTCTCTSACAHAHTRTSTSTSACAHAHMRTSTHPHPHPHAHMRTCA